jgi:L-rhamnose mutarotase
MQRVCFQLQVVPELMDEYRARHEAVWPDMLREIEASGRRNYSLFLRPDGLLVGYFEVDDLEKSTAYLAASETASRWEADATRFFAQLEGARPDQQFDQLTEVFNLEDQLALQNGTQS